MTQRMLSMYVAILFFISAFSIGAFAQEIEASAFSIDLQDSSFTRISYDNDLFRGTDRYYTQGIGIDVFSPCLEKNPMNVLLLRFKNADRSQHGVQFRTHGCTPTTILSDSVLIGDRPFAGVFSFGMVRTSHQNERKLRLTSQFELGMIGPAALGEQTQRGIHKITGDDLPLGWQHQIKNSLIVNYSLRLDKGLIELPSIFFVSGFGQAKIGTFQSQISTGLDLSLGFRNHPFSAGKHRFECYLYSQSALVLVGYDASLMGGIVNRDGYHLTYSQINPLVAKQHVGIVLAVPHVSVALDFAFISREIRHGLPHSWGGLRLLFW